MTKNITIKSTWMDMFDTSFFERYMLNSFQFSAAKSFSEAKSLQSLVFDKNKVLKPFETYLEDAKQVTEIFNETWLRVEYETARGQAVQAEKWLQMDKAKEIYPFWIYKGVMDDRERPEHVALEGKIFRIGDSYGDAIFPRCGWNCRCGSNTLAEDEVRGQKIYEDKEAKELLESKDKEGKYVVDPHFRYNSGKQGILPNNSSYFEVFPNASRGNNRMFGLEDIPHGRNAETFAAKGLHYLVEIVNKWREKYPVNKEGDIIFQNKEFLLNIKFSDNSLHNIEKNGTGIENIPATISNPDEIWGEWMDEKQMNVKLNFITFGKISYLVQIEKGVIQNAFLIANKNNLNKYRKGLIFLK